MALCELGKEVEFVGQVGREVEMPVKRRQVTSAGVPEGGVAEQGASRPGGSLYQ